MDKEIIIFNSVNYKPLCNNNDMSEICDIKKNKLIPKIKIITRT